MFVCNEKVVPLQRQTGKVDKQSIIGLWCNGNTTDSGPVFLGSNPSSPTDKNDYYFIGLWCNGNTTDSGPVFLGSNPSNPTERVVFNCSFFCCI